MDNISTGHWIFAGIFIIVFIVAMVYSYRKDLVRYKLLYKRPWLIVLGILLIYFIIFYLFQL